ncbi:TonB-dependent siderophore receptor [Prevotella sp. P6B4]|uniref:TonB-dependent receptor plug domain-containing protein n=1 Tax=Prevotella sp. P6B4 TaxID=1410614 RepID=UPI000688F3AD|nr:TonB-dependent receptor plug domain-containing protein [Prevotella sp. P6B4]
MTLVVQHTEAQDYFSAASDYARLYVGPIEPQYQLSTWYDIPYYKGNTNMYQGRISYCGVVYDHVKLRFDQLKQHVVVLSPIAGICCLPDQEHVDWFEMDGHRYVHDPEDSTRYASLLCDGTTNGIRLYHSVWKVFSGEELLFGEKKYLKTLSTEEYYTLITANGEKHHVKRASDITKLIPEQKKRIKQVVKQNRLSFSNNEREKSLVTVVENISGVPYHKPERQQAEKRQTPTLCRPATPIDDKQLISGIPVLDTDTISTGSARTTTYIVPGVKKARASISDDQELAEIVVVAGRQSAVKSTTMSSEKFKPQLLKNIPSAFGESDIMKIVLTLPGVTTVGEASSGYNVRGGATDQNLIVFNGGTVYNPSHLFGIFTSFNSDAVEDVELFKSSIPAEYGGRISSVLKVNSKEANMQKLTGSASIGALTSKANIEIPIVKDHVSLMLNGRTTYSDWILKLLPEDSGYKNGHANFFDLGGVLTWKLNNMHRLKIYGYWSHDKFSFSSEDNYGYQNRNISAEWRSILNEKTTATLSVGLDHYDYFNEEWGTPSMAARLSFGIDQLWGKLHIRQRLSDKQTLSYGLSMQHYNVQAGKYEPLGEESCIKTDQIQKEKALESAAYIEYEHSLTEKLSVSAGLRYSMFNALGPRDVNHYTEGELPSESTWLETRHETGIIKTYHAPEIRLSARYALKDNLSLKAGFNTMHQYIHKVSNTSIMSPTDIWKLSDLNIKPQNGWQVAAGIYHETAGKKYELSAEVYYKHIGDYLNYRSSAVLLMNPHLETDVISTKGKAYGIELQAKKPLGKLNGWVSYTYSRSLLRQDDKRVAMPLNDGDWYPSEYDRPHEVKATLNFKLTERYSFSSNFNYATGRPTTVPAGKYYSFDSYKYMPYYTDRNTYRIPDYMRLDLAFNIEPTHKLTSFLHTSFSIGVYNALARKNAYNIYYVNEGDEIKGYKLSVFGTAIPYVSLNIRFN